MADKPLQSLNFPGRDYTYVNTPLSTAPTFDNTVAYAIGDYVFYNRKLYKFIVAHSSGNWNSSQVEEVTVGNEIKNISNDLQDEYVKSTDYATANKAGVVKVYYNGLTMDNDGKIKILAAGAGDVKGGTSAYSPITPVRQHESVFYGLAKAAGDTTQSQSSNTVGTYTNEAKTAIKTMLDIKDEGIEVSDPNNNGILVFEEVGNLSNTGIIADTYSNLTTYDVGDYCIYEKRLYKCTSEISTAEEWNSSHWTIVNVGDELVNIKNGTVQDVQVNGTSVLGQDGTANIPVAGSNVLGVVKTDISKGLTLNLNGELFVREAVSSWIKSGSRSNNPITPIVQHESTFYGLAKAAGDTTQSQSSNAVGTYTDAAQGAIRKMLGTPGNSDIAYIETGVVAQRAYKVGDYFVDSDGILSKATDAIASGGSLVLDTNYEHVGGQGGLANDLFKPAELVADVTVGADIPSSVLSVPLSKPCRHLTIDIQNNGSALPSWSYIRLNRANSAPALQVNASSSVKRAYCVIDLINKVGITLLKNSSDTYANAGQITFDSREYILNTSVAEEIGFSFTNGMIEGFNIKVYGR